MSIVKAIQTSFAAKGASFPMDPGTYRAGMADLFQLGGQGPLHAFAYTDSNSALVAYEKCPPLTAIVNKKSQAYSNGKTWVMDGKGKESTTPYANDLRKLMIKPNPLQSWKDFDAQVYTTVQIFGYCIVFPILPVGRKDIISAKSLWALPGNMITIKYTKKLWYQTDLKGMIESIELGYDGTNTTLPLDSVHIFRGLVPSFSNMIFPESLVKSLQLPINNIIGAYESRNILINYRGALGILSNEGKDNAGLIPLKKDDKETLQRDFLRYGLKDQQWKFIITSANVKWQSMSVPTRDLMLFEEITDNTMTICDAYGYPYPLMSSARTNSLGGSNTDPNKAMLYQDTIMPEAESMTDQWNAFFKTHENGVVIEKDYDHVAVLQDDKAAAAAARKVLDEACSIEYAKGLITLDDWLAELGKDPLPGGVGQVRATDPGNSNVPLAVTIGVGGVQGLIAVLTAQGLSAEARQAILEITFGILPADAARMVAEPETDTETQPETV